MYSHYLEYYNGSKIDKDGKRIHIREFECKSSAKSGLI